MSYDDDDDSQVMPGTPATTEILVRLARIEERQKGQGRQFSDQVAALREHIEFGDRQSATAVELIAERVKRSERAIDHLQATVKEFDGLGPTLNEIRSSHLESDKRLRVLEDTYIRYRAVIGVGCAVGGVAGAMVAGIVVKFVGG